MGWNIRRGNTGRRPGEERRGRAVTLHEIRASALTRHHKEGRGAEGGKGRGAEAPRSNK